MIEKVCSECRSRQFRRVNRIGFLQHRVLTRLGYFPWECILCRRRSFFRDEGRRAMQALPTSQVSHLPQGSQMGK